MTPSQIAVAKALGRCSLPIGTAAKRFALDMAAHAERMPEKPISEKQGAYLLALATKFRRQMPAGLLDKADNKLAFTTLQWLGPEMARGGFLADTAWVSDHAAEAEAMFESQQALKTAAVMIATLHPRGIDYLNQAPVLALAITHGAVFATVQERKMAMHHLKPLIEVGPKLRDLLAHFGVAVQLRALASTALAPSRYWAVKMLSTVAPSTLAQVIPKTSGAQTRWLSALSSWENAMRCRFREPNKLASWAATNLVVLRRKDSRYAADLADFAGSRGSAFNERWDLAQAARASERWHAELAKKSQAEGFFARHGLQWDEPIDYGPLPVEFVADGEIRVVALRSGAEMFLEGQAMHHCVATYTSDVLVGRCRLYSVRRGAERLATFEISNDIPLSPIFPPVFKWSLRQIKGPCNAVPSLHARAAATVFLQSVNAPR